MHAARRLEGEVVLAAPPGNRLVCWLAVAVVLAALIFAATATYARKQTVAGWIVPEGGLIRVAAQQGGIVQQVFVEEGDLVAPNTALAKLKLSSDLSSGDAARAMTAQMAAEGVATEAQTAAARRKLSARRDELSGRIDILRRQHAETTARIALLAKRQALADAAVARGEALMAKGFLARSSMDTMNAAALSAAQDVSAARALAGDLEQQMSVASHELGAIPADAAALDAEAAKARAALSQRELSLQAGSAVVATAPIGGRIVAIPVEQGQVADAGGAVAVLMPAGAELTAELYVPSRAAGFIRPGQQVRLMYQAFPYQTFGAGQGVIRSVSRTVLAPREVAIPGLTVDEPVFRVRVALDRQSVAAYGKAVPLQPGMLLTANVVIDRRSLLEWLLDPLYAAGRRT